MLPPRLVLASASPARLRLLRDAGYDPLVRVSGVDERALAESLPARAGPRELVRLLAEAKAAAASAGLPASHTTSNHASHAPGLGAGPHLVLGCDSVLDVDGTAFGKPVGAAEATARWGDLAGRDADLLTGHALLEVVDGAVRRRVVEVARTTVHFGTPDPTEVAAYVATGEPTTVAGAFTIEGRGGIFIRGVTGCPSNVIGLSLPLLRDLLARLDVRATDLWGPAAC